MKDINLRIGKKLRKKKKLLLLLLILLGVWFIVRFVIGGSEDDWICENGQWVKHGNPAAPMPNEECIKE